MEISPLQATKIDTAGMPLEQLAKSTQVTEKEKVSRACSAFEAVLLRQILSECQRPLFVSKLVNNSTTAGIYRDLVVNQMAENISRSGSFGLARTLSGEMQRQTLSSGSAKSGATEAESKSTPTNS